jgi:tRNA modification GTPase
MYEPQDTIVAVSSPSSDHRVIFRIGGPQTITVLNGIFTPAVSGRAGITAGSVSVGPDIHLDAVAYLFRHPHSYTGDDLAEIHIWANPTVTGALMERLLTIGTRPADPGEFTARAYLNGKIDLAQAEAVNEVITASNAFQLAAAENLLAGQLGQTTKEVCSTILDLLSRLEAGLDFSTEDIEPANQADLIASLHETANQLRGLLNGSVRCESTLDLPSVGIAGAPNAGKSTLLNALLGRQRSIVSHKRKTTRDVLTGEMVFHGCRCVLFDCAGLITHAETMLDELAQQAAIQALQNATAVIFCVDAEKPELIEDLAIRQLTNPDHLIAVVTKADLVAENQIAARLPKLKSLFGCDFLPISAHTGFGLDKLKDKIAERLFTGKSTAMDKYGVALTARHRQAVTAAIADLVQAVDELKAGNDEVAAMMLRTAYHSLEGVEQHRIDELLLDRIFSHFCIGK